MVKSQLFKERYARVVRLRQLQAPRWIVKYEQVKMVLARRSSCGEQGLLDRHVMPLVWDGAGQRRND